MSNKIDNRGIASVTRDARAHVYVYACVCMCRNACRRNPLSARIYRGRKKPVVLVVNPHQSGDSRAMPATANSGKTFHSEIRLIQPRGPRLVNFSHRFPFFEIRREALPSPPLLSALNCKFDPDRSLFARGPCASIPSPWQIFSLALSLSIYPRDR